MNTTLAVKNMDTLKLIWLAVKDLIGRHGRRHELELPSEIAGYKLVETLFTERRHNKFQFGLYRGDDGKEYIAKQLSLKNPSLDEYWLRNEISVYKSLTELYDRMGNKIRSEFPEMNVPKLISVLDDKERLVSLMEKVEGKTLFEVPLEQRIRLMERAVDYFSHLNKIHDFKNQITTRRSIWQVVIISVLATMGALFKNSQMAKEIIRGELKFLAMSPWLMLQNKKELIHRDIGYSNIIIGENTNYVIDFELSSYMHPMFEITQLEIGCWNKEGFKESFQKSETMKKIRSNPQDRNLYKFLTIYSGIHALATHSKVGIHKDKIPHLEDYVRYGLSL